MEKCQPDVEELLKENDENDKDAALNHVLDESEVDADKEGATVMNEDDTTVFKEGDIVLVMRKKVEWPATILSVQDGEAEVRVFNTPK